MNTREYLTWTDDGVDAENVHNIRSIGNDLFADIDKWVRTAGSAKYDKLMTKERRKAVHRYLDWKYTNIRHESQHLDPPDTRPVEVKRLLLSKVGSVGIERDAAGRAEILKKHRKQDGRGKGRGRGRGRPRKRTLQDALLASLNQFDDDGDNQSHVMNAMMNVPDRQVRKRRRVGRDYVDYRRKYIRGLYDGCLKWKRSHWQQAMYDKADDVICRLALHNDPIRDSRVAKQRIYNLGDKLQKELKKIEGSDQYDVKPHPKTPHITGVTAILWVMYHIIERTKKRSNEEFEWSDKRAFVPLETLFEKASSICEEHLGTYSNTKSTGWKRLRFLEKEGYIKKRSRQKKPVFELLSQRSNTVHRIVREYPVPVEHSSISPSPAARPQPVQSPPQVNSNNGLSSDIYFPQVLGGNPNAIDRIADANARQEASFHSESLFDNMTNVDMSGVILLFDRREQGGDPGRLERYSNEFRREKITFRSLTLPTGLGDYVFAIRHNRIEYILPCIIERKTILDLAASLHDDRYAKQKEAMLKTRQFFMDLRTLISEFFPEEPLVHYIIEGNPVETYIQCNPDQCARRCIGQCRRSGNYPNETMVNEVIDSLKHDSRFGFVRTRSGTKSAQYLAQVFGMMKGRFSSETVIRKFIRDYGSRLEMNSLKERLSRIARLGGEVQFIQRDLDERDDGFMFEFDAMQVDDSPAPRRRTPPVGIESTFPNLRPGYVDFTQDSDDDDDHKERSNEKAEMMDIDEDFQRAVTMSLAQHEIENQRREQEKRSNPLVESVREALACLQYGGAITDEEIEDVAKRTGSTDINEIVGNIMPW